MAKTGVVRFIVREVLKNLRKTNEATTTGNVAGYSTPFAFSSDSDKSKKRKYFEKQGYTIVSENRWLELKQDINRTDPRKIADGISHVNKQLSEIEKYLSWYGKIKNESNLTPNKYHVRTKKQLGYIRERLMRLQSKIQRLQSDV